MRTKEELEEKYKEMLANTEKLKKPVHNPTDETIGEIQEAIKQLNEQYSLNALMEWVLKIR
jgi:hypothetical protein